MLPVLKENIGKFYRFTCGCIHQLTNIYMLKCPDCRWGVLQEPVSNIVKGTTEE